MSESTMENPGGMTALHLAAGAGNLPEITRLLDAGADPNALNLEDQPPLFNALELSMAEGAEARPPKEAIFRALWVHTNPSIRLGSDSDGNTVLQLMARYGFAELAEERLNDAPRLAEKANIAGNYPIHTAILSAQQAVAEKLFSADSNTSTYQDAKGRTPLHLAARHGSLDMVKLCCLAARAAGANIDAMDGEGMTALAFAMDGSGRQDDTIRDYLIEAGAKERAVNFDARTQMRFE